MQLRWPIALASLLIGSLSVGAQPVKLAVNFIEPEESGRSVRIKPKPKILKLQATPHILCMNKMRTGSRIKVRRCQTIADWKSEIENEHNRQYLLE